jgi:hypothetical protein
LLFLPALYAAWFRVKPPQAALVFPMALWSGACAGAVTPLPSWERVARSAGRGGALVA